MLVRNLPHVLGMRLGQVASVALLVAAVGAAALIVAGFFAPMYESHGVSSSGEVTRGTETLVGQNGLGSVAALTVPLLATVVVGLALWRRSRSGAVVAWTVTGLLAVITLLSMLSIGVFILPVTAALVVACGTTPWGSVAHAPAPR